MKKIITWTFSLLLVASGLVWPYATFFGVTARSISENGLSAKFFTSSGTKKTTVVTLGGDPWSNFWGDRLASNGHAALSLKYFGDEGLPEKMEEIPLEYFERAIDWLRTQPEVDSEKILVMGSGRDGELALLLAATYPEKIHGAIAWCPGSVHWSNTVFPWNSDEIKPTWTKNGLPVPFIRMEKIKGGDSETLDGMPYWNSGLDDKAQVDSATIKVERISGPILLITPEDDQLWPSLRMSEMITQRLIQHNFQYDFKNLRYENAGHRLRLPLHKALTAEQVDIEVDGKVYGCNLGGTPLGNFEAQWDSRGKVDEFVDGFSRK